MMTASSRQWMAHVLFVVLISASAPFDATAVAARSVSVPRVQPNDNRHPAGTLERGTLTLALRAGTGHWQPEGPSGPTLEIEAFGEVGKALVVPAPLVRVVEGTATSPSWTATGPS